MVRLTRRRGRSSGLVSEAAIVVKRIKSTMLRFTITDATV